MNSPAQNSLLSKLNPSKTFVNLQALPRKFYLQETSTVAKKLLGKGLLRISPEGPLLCEIIETEAYYGGGKDAASHAHKGLSKRNASMFELGGTSYVYLIYGINHCLNVVTSKKGVANAVLLRAGKPLMGIEQMYENRGLPLDNSSKTLKNLLNGPGKLAKAFGIDLQHDGLTFNRKDFRIVDLGRVYSSKEVTSTTRVGISQAKDLQLRFFVTESDFVSRKK